MTEFRYKIQINKPVEEVVKTMMDKEVYPHWAKAWGENMTFDGEWKVGSSLIFHDDKGGTKALVEAVEPNASIKMKHVAMVGPDGEELKPSDEAMKKWIGSIEEYYFTEDGEDQTTVEVVMHTDEMFREMSEGAWPKALQYLKELCESP